MCVVLYLEAVAGWLKQSQLKLNPSKIVVLCLGWEETRIGIQLPALDRVLLTPAPTAKSLGLTFRCFDRHGSPNPKCCQIWFFSVFVRLDNWFPISPLGLVTLTYAIFTSKLDYCNSLYAELPLRLSWKLQLVQNAATWVLTGTPVRAHMPQSNTSSNSRVCFWSSNIPSGLSFLACPPKNIVFDWSRSAGCLWP